jgi:transmembrane protein 18
LLVFLLLLLKDTGPQTFRENWDAFRSAITWTEPFIIGLLCFQLFMFVTTLYVSRKNFALGPRIAVMVVIGLLVRTSEYSNTWASTHWPAFATQDYFDSRGVFMSGMVCGPLLLDSLIMLICFLREAAQLLIQVKTMQIKKSRATTGRPKQAKAKKEQ